MKTRVLSVFIQPLCWLFCFLKQQGMSNSCFYSFCRFVKAGLCSLTPGTPRQQSGQAAPREMVPDCQLAPRSREPGPLGMLAERDKLTLQAAFLLSDFKKKKAPRDNLPSVTIAQKH